MSDRLFPLDEVPEVPIFREPRLVGARAANDARFRNDYPPEWDKCTTCDGRGKIRGGVTCGYVGEMAEYPPLYPIVCPDCLGMGSLKARVRLEAGHRCIRCKHPYVPKGDAKMLSAMLPEGDVVLPSGLHECETCLGHGFKDTAEIAKCGDCKGTGKVWTPWSACDEHCTHDGPYRVWAGSDWREGELLAPEVLHLHYINGTPVEAIWRILTVHHLDGDKANVRWWNLMAACQRCHLEVQAKVIMERVYPHPHSEWFRPHVAGYYAWSYLGEDLSRAEVDERMDELLALELDPAYG